MATMRTYLSLAVATFILIGCGGHERPRAAELMADNSSSSHSEKSAALFANNDEPDAATTSEPTASSSGGTCHPETCASEGLTCGTWDDGCGEPEYCGTCPAGQACTNDAGGTCAPIGSICKASDMRLLGSCVPDDEAAGFASGANCEEHWDSRARATTEQLEYACNCAKGTWSPQPCSERVKLKECAIEGNGGASCTRDVSCYPSLIGAPH